MNEQQQALLDQLQGVHIPAISRVPAIGWWVLLVLLLLALYAAYRWRRYYRARRWQREARAELASLRSRLDQQNAGQILAQSSRLTRRVVLASNAREEVASLQGQPWLETLDAICKRPVFASGFGSLLESAPYQSDPQVSTQDLASLLDAIDELINAAARTGIRES